MPEETFPGVDVAVAMILDDDKQKFLWTWNPRWRVFSLPSSRVRPRLGLPAAFDAAAREAAERAAAEALGVPVVVRSARRLQPILEHSGRDGRLKSYTYAVFSAAPHERFAHQVKPGARSVWLAGHEVLSGEFRPLSVTSVKIVEQLAEANLVPGRHQLASTVLLTRGSDDAPEFLMRWNPEWGYFFPSQRRNNAEDSLQVAEHVVAEELGLQPKATVSLSPARREPVTFHDRSESTDVPTYYVHNVFNLRLHEGAKLNSRASLVWVPLADVVAGTTEGTHLAGATGTAHAGPVSRTARRILEVLGYF